MSNLSNSSIGFTIASSCLDIVSFLSVICAKWDVWPPSSHNPEKQHGSTVSWHIFTHRVFISRTRRPQRSHRNSRPFFVSAISHMSSRSHPRQSWPSRLIFLYYFVNPPRRWNTLTLPIAPTSGGESGLLVVVGGISGSPLSSRSSKMAPLRVNYTLDDCSRSGIVFPREKVERGCV